MRYAIVNGLALVAGLLWVAAASAAVTARVDRPTVDLNESFTLEIVVDSNTDLEPDLSILHENFFVGQVSKLSNTSIYNGDIKRSLTWTVAFMPKKTGIQHIPAIEVGTEQSNPVRIVVNEPTNAPPGEADVFVTSEVDVDETYVQAQILYRIRIYRAVNTRQPALREAGKLKFLRRVSRRACYATDALRVARCSSPNRTRSPYCPYPHHLQTCLTPRGCRPAMYNSAKSGPGHRMK